LARIALIFPPTAAVTVMPPLGLGYLAAVLREGGHQVAIHDLARRHLTIRQLGRVLAETRPRYVGLSVMTPNYEPAVAVSEMLRDLPFDPTVFVGGPHVSAHPEFSLFDFKADYAFVREAEQSLPGVVDALENGRDPGTIAGVMFRRDGQFVATGPAPYVRDLDKLPWVAWDLLEPEKYPPIPHQLFVRRLPVAPILTTRGCPFNCAFCATTQLFGGTIRRRAPRDVVREMAHLADRHGVREFHIEDDNPTLVREHIESFCNELLASGRQWVWKFPNGVMVNSLDEKLVNLMADAGCYQISLGIETMNEGTVVGKKVDHSRIAQIVRWAKKRGVQTQGLFVIGLPSEDEATVERSVRASARLGLDFAHYGNFVPLPGSEWGDAINKEKRDFRNINFFTAKGLSALEPETAKSLQRRAILRFYLRPRILWNLLKMVKLRQLGGVFYTARRYLLG
jgi:radical SAM superfamily enzyme YgiQ (UPF0313 family)